MRYALSSLFLISSLFSLAAQSDPPAKWFLQESVGSSRIGTFLSDRFAVGGSFGDLTIGGSEFSADLYAFGRCYFTELGKWRLYGEAGLHYYNNSGPLSDWAIAGSVGLERNLLPGLLANLQYSNERTLGKVGHGTSTLELSLTTQLLGRSCTVGAQQQLHRGAFYLGGQIFRLQESRTDALTSRTVDFQPEFGAMLTDHFLVYSRLDLNYESLDRFFLSNEQFSDIRTFRATAGVGADYYLTNHKKINLLAGVYGSFSYEQSRAEATNGGVPGPVQRTVTRSFAVESTVGASMFLSQRSSLILRFGVGYDSAHSPRVSSVGSLGLRHWIK